MLKKTLTHGLPKNQTRTLGIGTLQIIEPPSHFQSLSMGSAYKKTNNLDAICIILHEGSTFCMLSHLQRAQSLFVPLVKGIRPGTSSLYVK